ncbi:MAG: hypothetical protein ACK6DO_13025 [Planctomycetia bacterium]
MSSAQFDPCRQWLGIDAVELGDPRRVLGLLPTEADPLVVLRAADARLTLLRSIAPGPFDMARNALIKRVEESREAVLSQIAAAPKPPVPVGTQFTMPPAPTATSGSQPPPMPPFAESATPWGEPKSAEDGFVAVKTRPVYRKQSSGTGGLLLLLALLAAAAGGLAWYWKNGKPLKTTLTLTRGGDVTGIVRENADSKPQRQPEPEPQPQASPKTAPNIPSGPPVDPPKPKPKPKPKPEPEPEPSTEEPAPKESPDAAATAEADAEAIEPFLKKALAALQDDEFDDADDALGQAGDEAMGRAAADRLAQWQALVAYARGFADLREQALDAARAGLEYEIDGKRVAIVEIDNAKVIYRLTGKNKTVPRSRLPAKLMLAIVTKWFDRKPANQLYLGAYQATKPQPDLDKAREAWHLAERGGADASELLPLLDDPVLLNAAGDPGRDGQ